MTDRLGLIVRADQGGLGTLTSEVARHVEHDAVLIVDLHERGRGDSDYSRFTCAQRFVTRYPVEPDVVRAFLASIDRVWTAETFYDQGFEQWARDAGVHRTLYAMPELFDVREPACRADRYLVPTRWRREHMGVETHVLPMPVALDRFPHPDRLSGRPELPLHVVHMHAPAMEDRNGTEALMSALPLIRRPVVVTLLGPSGKRDPATSWRIGEATVRFSGRRVDDYADNWRDGAAFVLPRRYGGLSLPLLEAAAAGMAIVTTALPPQVDDMAGAASFVSATRSKPVRMKGGHVDVHQPHIAQLAATIEMLAGAPTKVRRQGEAARAWASARSWERLCSTWNVALRG